MTEKVLTKKTFIGHGAMGHMGYPGDVVDVDAKGVPMPADSTPVGALTAEQLRARLEKLEADEKPADPDFGKNVADADDGNTGAQALAIAPVAPHAPGAVNPQGLPPGTAQVGDRFIRPAAEEASAAVEEVVADPLDHDGDGRKGGSRPRGKK